MAPPTRIAHYEITGKLGEGGMGVVYRAIDTRLNREVAIKVLPPTVASDLDRMMRFEREARLLASLNHPNINAIYGIEQSGEFSALVLALIEGPTLADRIAAGPAPLEEAIRIVRQLAEALEYAHERGIIHRDLKPANLKVTPEGTVKVLDFGLALALTNDGAGSASGDPSISPTLSMHATRMGTILGTAAYMAPEQAKGKAVDRRADIWAFGAIFLELLTGRPAFGGDTVAEVLASAIKEPPLYRLPADTPAAVRRLIARCLEKDPRQRLQAIGEARILLAAPLEETIAAPPPAAGTGTHRLPWAIAAALLLALAALGWRYFHQPVAAARQMRFQIPAPEKTELESYLSVSPDGRRLAFRASDGQVRIWIRALDALDVRPLAGTEGVQSFFWSPDSRYIAFAAGRKLKKVEASGGPTQTVTDLSSDELFLGGAWGADGMIVFGFSKPGMPLMRVPATGGAPVPIIAPDPDHPSLSLSPSFLPDGRHFVYEFCPDPPYKCGIYLRSLDARPEERDTKPLIAAEFATHPGDTAVAYAVSPDPNFGYVLFERDGSLMALPFDARRLEAAGLPVLVAAGIGRMARSFSASPGGILAFRPDNTTIGNRSLLWFDRHGKPLGQLGSEGPWTGVALSPDGKFAAVNQSGQSSGSVEHVWTIDTARGVPTRLNPGDIIEYIGGGAISPDGRVAFTYMKDGVKGDIYARPASGVGEPQLLVASKNMKHPFDWSLDGRFLLFDTHSPEKIDLCALPMTGDRKPIRLLTGLAGEASAGLSPDSRWIAYSSRESARDEVYVQGFLPDHVPATGIGKWQISTAGGRFPLWRRDGKELYYIAPDRKVMAVSVVSTATGFRPGVAVPLFQLRAGQFRGYDVTPDGRFLIDIQTQEAPHNTAPITVVLNWWAALKQ